MLWSTSQTDDDAEDDDHHQHHHSNAKQSNVLSSRMFNIHRKNDCPNGKINVFQAGLNKVFSMDSETGQTKLSEKRMKRSIGG